MNCDAIVVGARCGGAPTAMLLARKGYKVLLVDRAKFPSDIAHGNVVHRGGPKRLQRWGLLQTIVDRGCPPIDRLTHAAHGCTLVAADMKLDGIAFAYAPRRTLLDHVLVEAAVAAGAELREDFNVDEYLLEDGRIAGISGGTRGRDRRESVRAAITVGADGRRSRLAATVKALEYEAAPTLTVCWFSFWSGFDERGLEIHQHSDFYVAPADGGVSVVGVGWKAGECQRVQANPEAAFMAAIDATPAIAGRLHAARREERWYAAADLPNFYRKPYGPGWALVGDAGSHKDPIMALGISDALRDAELLADAIDQGLGATRPMTEAMADYELRRNQASMELYRLNQELARFTPPPPDEIALIRALESQPEETRRYFMAREGLIPPQSFFNPENIARIVAAREAA